jgi:hypothetical protein
MDLKHNEGNEVTQDNARKQIKMIKSSSGQCLRVDAPTLGRNGYRERQSREASDMLANPLTVAAR